MFPTTLSLQHTHTRACMRVLTSPTPTVSFILREYINVHKAFKVLSDTCGS